MSLHLPGLIGPGGSPVHRITLLEERRDRCHIMRGYCRAGIVQQVADVEVVEQGRFVLTVGDT